MSGLDWQRCQLAFTLGFYMEIRVSQRKGAIYLTPLSIRAKIVIAAKIDYGVACENPPQFGSYSLR